MRFQHHRTSYAVTYPTRELAEDAEPLLRAAALAGRRNTSDADDDPCPPSSPAPSPPGTPTPDEVRSLSAAAAESIDAILADIVHDHQDQTPAPDEVLTTGQAAVLLGVSRPTLVAWLEAGRIPFHWCGTHRRVNRSEILAYRDRLQDPNGSRQRLSSIAGSLDVAARGRECCDEADPAAR